MCLSKRKLSIITGRIRWGINYIKIVSTLKFNSCEMSLVIPSIYVSCFRVVFDISKVKNHFECNLVYNIEVAKRLLKRKNGTNSKIVGKH